MGVGRWRRFATPTRSAPRRTNKWREQFLAHAHETFEAGRQSRREARLEQENTELKGLVGELTMELKKTDGGCR